MKVKEFLEPFSTSNFEVYMSESDCLIQLNDREDHDVIIEEYGNYIVTDVGV